MSMVPWHHPVAPTSSSLTEPLRIREHKGWVDRGRSGPRGGWDLGTSLLSASALLCDLRPALYSLDLSLSSGKQGGLTYVITSQR